MNKVKELNIIEAIEMPVGTEFKVLYNDGDYNASNAFVSIDADEDILKVLCWENNPKDLVWIDEEIATAKFIPIQKPISFQEAYYQNKLLILEISENIKEYLVESVDDKYRTMEDIVGILRKSLSNRTLIKVLFEGKWYAEA